MKRIILIVIPFIIAGCMTTSGNYTLAAFDVEGNELSGNFILTAQGRRIYPVRNALCSLHPNATVIIKDSRTGEELKSESPYQCSNRTSKNTNNVSSNAGDISHGTKTQADSNTNVSSVLHNTRQPAQSIYQSKEEIEKELAANNNGTSKSRIRLFGQNNTGVVFYRNTKCVKENLGKEDQRVSGGFSDALSSFMGTVSNTSIGMPETETTKNLKRNDRLLSKTYFREYVIEGNKAVTIDASFQDVSNVYASNGITYSKSGARCQKDPLFPIAVWFMPIAGADYEVSFKHSDGNCDLRVNRISQKEVATMLRPVHAYVAYPCEND